MTAVELLKACANGAPKVRCTIPIKGTTSDIGWVVTLRLRDNHQGCAVIFSGLKYEVWFWDEAAGKDGRTHYMHQLELVENTPTVIDEQKVLNALRFATRFFNRAIPELQEHKLHPIVYRATEVQNTIEEALNEFTDKNIKESNDA